MCCFHLFLCRLPPLVMLFNVLFPSLSLSASPSCHVVQCAVSISFSVSFPLLSCCSICCFHLFLCRLPPLVMLFNVLFPSLSLSASPSCHVVQCAVSISFSVGFPLLSCCSMCCFHLFLCRLPPFVMLFNVLFPSLSLSASPFCHVVQCAVSISFSVGFPLLSCCSMCCFHIFLCRLPTFVMLFNVLFPSLSLSASPSCNVVQCAVSISFSVGFPLLSCCSICCFHLFLCRLPPFVMLFNVLFPSLSLSASPFCHVVQCAVSISFSVSFPLLSCCSMCCFHIFLCWLPPLVMLFNVLFPSLSLSASPSCHVVQCAVSISFSVGFPLLSCCSICCFHLFTIPSDSVRICPISSLTWNQKLYTITLY